MAYCYQLKLSSITNLSDARFAAAAGINYLGFCFDTSSSDLIPPLKAKEIIDWTSGSHIVGEFGEQSQEEILTIAELLDVDILEFANAFEPQELEAFELPIIKVIDVAASNYNQVIEAFTKYDAFVQAFRLKNWEKLEQQGLEALSPWKAKLFLDIQDSGLYKEQLLASFSPFGLSLHGGKEEQVGMKDFDTLNTFLQQIEN